MRSWIGIVAIGAALLCPYGCSQTGAVCPQSGSTDGCGDGTICTFVTDPNAMNTDPNSPILPPVNVCLRLCDKSTDCGAAEVCRLVYCSEKLSCQTGPLVLELPENLCTGVGGSGGAGGTGGDGGAGGSAGMGGTGGTGGVEGCDSTATAFIKTLDPMSGFALTNLVEEDTTNLPDTWGRYSLELEIDAGLVDQLLQVGFNATAANFEPSGVFYDNILVDPNAEYTQDFENPPIVQADPDALANDGWIVFANVADPEGTFIRGYGPDPAPNGQIQGFSAVASGQGGPEQGEQQLSIISDYNNTGDQSAGNRVEANTFQERTITAADVGNTIMFSFDAKRGNINEGCPPPETP